MNIQLPSFLQKGDKVVIVSPSSKIDKEFLKRAKKRLESWGLKVSVGKYAGGSSGRYAGTVRQRLQDLQSAMDDPKVKAILCSRGGYGAVHLVAGHDYHFGYKNQGDPRLLQEKCRELGMGCDIIQKVEQDGITISSTYIRTLIAQGEVERADQFLGHPHTLTNRVAHGKKIGTTTLGFPTVNLLIPQGVIVPAYGVYATRVWFDGQCRCAVTNVGVRPTVEDNDGHVTVEGFILDFDGDLYGHEIRMEFYKYLRPEQCFPSMDALAAEIRRNAQQTRDYFRQLT